MKTHMMLFQGDSFFGFEEKNFFSEGGNHFR